MTNGVARLYDRLNATERTSALLAAWVRGDAVESHRLNATAPRRTEQRWHHHDRVKAIWNIAAMVRIEMLGTLANLWHAQARLAWATDNAEANGDAAEAVSDDVVREVRLWRAFADVCCCRLLSAVAATSGVEHRLRAAGHRGARKKPRRWTPPGQMGFRFHRSSDECDSTAISV